MDVLILDCSSASINGECQLTDFNNMIECLSFSHGVAQQITGDQSNTKRTSGKPSHQDFTITKFQDLATASLIDYCNQAKPIPTIKVTVGQNDNGKVTKFFIFELTNALVSSISVGGGGGGKPQETVTFNYTKITWTYAAQKSDVTDAGNASATWNLATNSAS
ncbi:MAG: type VI secretion system tube protein Hcp [Bryobacterales bacterium]|nr:type VI secretion system tube protein Hcp [Bryobacterales bacterium]